MLAVLASEPQMHTLLHCAGQKDRCGSVEGKCTGIRQDVQRHGSDQGGWEVIIRGQVTPQGDSTRMCSTQLQLSAVSASSSEAAGLTVHQPWKCWGLDSSCPMGKGGELSPALGQHHGWCPCKLCNQARVYFSSVYESGITPV
jgi:hypothetical protein